MDISQLLKYASDTNCSDIHITAGTHLALRRYGSLFFLDDIPTITEAEAMIMSFLSEEDETRVREGHDIDVGCRLPDRTRIRVNVYHQRGKYSQCAQAHELNQGPGSQQAGRHEETAQREGAGCERTA